MRLHGFGIRSPDHDRLGIPRVENVYKVTVRRGGAAILRVESETEQPAVETALRLLREVEHRGLLGRVRLARVDRHDRALQLADEQALRARLGFHHDRILERDIGERRFRGPPRRRSEHRLGRERQIGSGLGSSFEAVGAGEQSRPQREPADKHGKGKGGEQEIETAFGQGGAFHVSG